jgi:hypothetical protein
MATPTGVQNVPAARLPSLKPRSPAYTQNAPVQRKMTLFTGALPCRCEVRGQKGPKLAIRGQAAIHVPQSSTLGHNSADVTYTRNSKGEITGSATSVSPGTGEAIWEGLAATVIPAAKTRAKHGQPDLLNS